jgi:hypothetical protein
LENEQINNIPYAFAIDISMYIQVNTKLDLIFIIGMLRRIKSNSGIDHCEAAKKLIRYL